MAKYGEVRIGYSVTRVSQKDDVVFAYVLDGDAPVGLLEGTNPDRLHLTSLEYPDDREQVWIRLYEADIDLPLEAWRALAKSLS